MGFEGLTSGERKRLKAGILKPEEARLVSARAIAKSGGGGFWGSGWGQVLRTLGIAALNAIPAVGSIASAGLNAYDKQRVAELQRKATETYKSELQASQQRAADAKRQAVLPFLETSPYPWLPDYGRIGITGGYTGGTAYVGGQASGPSLEEQVYDAFGSVQPWQWLVIVGGVVLLLLLFFKGK